MLGRRRSQGISMRSCRPWRDSRIGLLCRPHSLRGKNVSRRSGRQELLPLRLPAVGTAVRPDSVPSSLVFLNRPLVVFDDLGAELLWFHHLDPVAPPEHPAEDLIETVDRKGEGHLPVYVPLL